MYLIRRSRIIPARFAHDKDLIGNRVPGIVDPGEQQKQHARADAQQRLALMRQRRQRHQQQHRIGEQRQQDVT
jgi:hypothetical protein